MWDRYTFYGVTHISLHVAFIAENGELIVCAAAGSSLISYAVLCLIRSARLCVCKVLLMTSVLVLLG